MRSFHRRWFKSHDAAILSTNLSMKEPGAPLTAAMIMYRAFASVCESSSSLKSMRKSRWSPRQTCQWSCRLRRARRCRFRGRFLFLPLVYRIVNVQIEDGNDILKHLGAKFTSKCKPQTASMSFIFNMWRFTLRKTPRCATTLCISASRKGRQSWASLFESVMLTSLAIAAIRGASTCGVAGVTWAKIVTEDHFPLLVENTIKQSYYLQF